MFAKEAKNAGYDVPFCLAEFSGDHFIVTPNEIKGAFCQVSSLRQGREQETAATEMSVPGEPLPPARPLPPGVRLGYNRSQRMRKLRCAAAGPAGACSALAPGAAAGLPDVLAPENDNEARLNRLQPPDQVLDAIGVRPGMTVAEIGAGRGRYAVQLAVRVGPAGRVYAEDIDAAALDHLRRRCPRWGLEHVEVILGDVTDPKLPPGRLDLIWIVSSYHHFDDPVALLRRARSALKPGGRLAIGEWITIRESRTARHDTSENIIRQVESAGYPLERTETFLKENNFLIHLFRSFR